MKKNELIALMREAQAEYNAAETAEAREAANEKFYNAKRESDLLEVEERTANQAPDKNAIIREMLQGVRTDKKGADGIYERTITKIDSIFEVTVAASPAYPATTASCREAWQADRAEAIRKREEEEAAKAAAAKAEEEAKAKAEQEAAEREKFTRERTSTAMRMELDLLNY